jgi:Flp pilus assembly protein TadB
MPPDQQGAGRSMARILVLTGAATIVLGIVLGALVWAPLYAIAALALVDFGLAWAYSNGRMRVASGGSAPAPGAADPSADPSYNPYARED